MRLVTIVILICLITATSYADEGSFNVCTYKNYGMNYDDSTGKIFRQCISDTQYYYLNIIDPLTLDTERTFQFNGKTDEILSLNNGATLLVCLSDYDMDPSTYDGKLIEVDYLTGNTLRELDFDQRIMTMITSQSEDYVYLRIGCRQTPPQKIVKVLLSTFQVVDEVVFGKMAAGIEITPNGSMLYVDSKNIYPVHPSMSLQGVGVINTSDMELVGRFALPFSANAMEMSDDGTQLFISSTNYEEVDYAGDLYVIDTQTDEITEKLRFFYNGTETATWDVEFCGQNNKLYCTVSAFNDNVIPDNLILEIDLTDYSYNYFPIPVNSIGVIALAPLPSGPRLFVTESGTPVVYYKDI